MAAGRGRGGFATFVWVLLLQASVMARPTAVGKAEGKRTTRVPAVFVFGDSIVDVGNNNYLPNCTAKGDFPHNGVDYPGKKATGRFSNGYNTADYIARQYGFKRSPPAFLSLSKSKLKRSICKGINFASAGCGILDTTGISLGGFVSVNAQLDDFKTSLKRFRARRCLMSRSAMLSKSVFVLHYGSNDLFGLYYMSNGSRDDLATPKFITNLASKYERQIMTLYRLGARRFGVLGLATTGCCPNSRQLTASGECVAALDDLAIKFNVALRKVLESFSSKHKEMKYSFGDMYNIWKKILDDPLAYGFKETKIACCGEGRFNGELGCTPNATLCSNRRDHYFWDWYHPTSKGCKLHARLLFKGPRSLAFPINFGELAEG